MEYCRGPECEKEAARDGLCWAHLKQLERTGRTKPVKDRPADAEERLFEASLALADADAEDDRAFRAAKRRFRAARDAWFVHELEVLLEKARASTGGRKMRER